MEKRWTYIAVALLLAAFAAQVLPPLIEKSGVCDEHGAHLPSGYVYWKTGVFCGGINNPPLMQLLTAAPLALARVDYSPFSDENIWAARLPVLLIALALGGVVFAWARSLYGRAAGLAALFLFCFEPNVLAHSGLATVDLGVAAFAFAAFFFLWRSFLSKRRLDWIVSSLLMSLALLSKFTALFLLPIFLVLLLIAVCRKGSAGSRLARGIVALIAFAVCFIVISHALYNAPAVSADAHLVKGISTGPFSTAESAGPGGVAATSESVAVRAALLFLPDLYVDGALGKLRHSAGGHFAYLMGERSLQGWWYYFPVAIGLKTPIPFLAAFCLSLVLCAGLKTRGAGPRERVAGPKAKGAGTKVEGAKSGGKDAGSSFGGTRSDEPEVGSKSRGIGYVFLVLPMVFYILAMGWTGVNIGVRHVLIFYPAAAVVASALLTGGLRRNGFFLVVLVLGGMWHLSGALRVHPHHLAYFNGIAGGPIGGPRYLIDSNIDWGQDEKLLAEFISQQPDTVLVNPGAFAPSVGTIAVNVNSLRGILRGDDLAYGWLRQFEPEETLGYTWYVYRLTSDDYRLAALEAAPEVEPRFWYAISLNREGQLEEGLSEVRSIANEFPDLAPRAWLTSGRWLFRKGRYTEAIELLSKAVGAGGARDAEVTLDAALKEEKWSRGGASAEELVLLGRYYIERARLRRAREAFEAAIELEPENGDLLLAVAQLLARRGRFQEAAESARRAVDLLSESGRAAQIAGEAEELAAKQDLVAEDLSAKAGAAPPSAEELADRFEALMTLAQLHDRYERPAEAALYYWRAFNLNPSSQQALTAMGDIVVRIKLGALKPEAGWPFWESKYPSFPSGEKKRERGMRATSSPSGRE